MRKIVVIVPAALAAAATGWFIGMRTGWRPVVDLQRRVNRDLLNPRMRSRLGTSGGPTAIIHHTGRKSATAYSTPVGAVPTEDGFAVASVYGLRSDWIRNVLAGGPAAVQTGEGTFEVAQAQIVPLAEVERYFPASDRRSMRLFGVTDAVVLRTGPPASDVAEAAPSQTSG